MHPCVFACWLGGLLLPGKPWLAANAEHKHIQQHTNLATIDLGRDRSSTLKPSFSLLAFVAAAGVPSGTSSGPFEAVDTFDFRPGMVAPMEGTASNIRVRDVFLSFGTAVHWRLMEQMVFVLGLQFYGRARNGRASRVVRVAAARSFPLFHADTSKHTTTNFSSCINNIIYEVITQHLKDSGSDYTTCWARRDHVYTPRLTAGSGPPKTNTGEPCVVADYALLPPSDCGEPAYSSHHAAITGTPVCCQTGYRMMWPVNWLRYVARGLQRHG